MSTWRITTTYNRVTILCWMCTAVLFGIWLPKWGMTTISFSAWWLLGVIPVVLIVGRHTHLWALTVLCGVGLVVGAQRGSWMQAKLQSYAPLQGQTVHIEGRIRDDPAYDDKHRLDFRLEQVTVAGQKLPGQVRVWTQSASGLQRGDTVRVAGKLREGFGNYQGAVSFAEVRLLRRSPNVIEKIRRQFFVGVYNAVPDPQASLGLGFLVGFKSQLPGELEDQLRVLALSHIVVASGYNLTVLVRLAKRVLARVSKFQAYVGAIGFMSLMLLLTGLSPSMTRAGVVTFLSLSTWYFGRKVHPILLLLLSAALTAWWNPLSTWSDLGWWLSFLAFAGVLVVGPIITKRLYGERAPPTLAQVAIETLAAQVTVEPLIMLLFGQFSTLGLVANLLVVSFVPLAMLATFIAGLAGMVLPMIAGWFALPAQFVLGYIVEIVRLLATIPWASWELQITKVGFGVLYGAVALWVCIMAKKSHFSFREAPSVID